MVIAVYSVEMVPYNLESLTERLGEYARRDLLKGDTSSWISEIRPGSTGFTVIRREGYHRHYAFNFPSEPLDEDSIVGIHVAPRSYSLIEDANSRPARCLELAVIQLRYFHDHIKGLEDLGYTGRVILGADEDMARVEYHLPIHSEEEARKVLSDFLRTSRG